MAKENEFVETLQQSVEGDVLLRAKVESLQKELIELQSQAITTPEQEKRKDEIVAEIAKIVKESKKQDEKAKKKETDVIEQEKKSVEGKSISEIEQEGEEEVAKKDEEGELESEKENNSTQKAYEDAMQRLHEFRIKMYNNQMDGNEVVRLIPTREEFKQEMELEKTKIALRTKYEAELGGKSDELQAKEEGLASKERQAREPIQREIRIRAQKYADAMLKLHKINLELAYIHKLKREGKISEEDFDARKSKALNEKMKIKNEVAQLNPEELMKAMDELATRDKERGRELGADFEIKEYERATEDEKANLNYRKSQQEKVERNLEFAQEQEIENLEDSISENERHIELLSKELRELPEEDIKRRCEILKELESANLQLEQEQEQMAILERGEEISPEKQIRENAKDNKEVSELNEEQVERYAKTEAAIEEIEKIEGERAIKNPESEEKKQEEKEAAIIAAATMGGVVLEDSSVGEKDSYVETIVAATLVGGLSKEDPIAKNMPGLLEVRDPNNPEDAQKMVELDDKLRSAQRELEINENAVSK